MPSTNRAHQSRKARDLTANPRRDSRSSTPPIARESRKHPPQMAHPSWPCPQGAPAGLGPASSPSARPRAKPMEAVAENRYFPQRAGRAEISRAAQNSFWRSSQPYR